MDKIQITPFELAQRFIGIKEVAGTVDNPFIMSMLKLDQSWPEHDEVPWCSAFVNYICWLLRLPRSKDLRARSWLLVGKDLCIPEAEAGFDIIVLKRGEGRQPGPEIIDAPGHVGFFAAFNSDEEIEILGGNQSNQVGTTIYSLDKLLSVRRLII